MALDKLGIYNDALQLIGERSLANITEDREPRHKLDASWDLGAVDICLELVKPVSQSLTALLNTPSTSSVHDLDSVHTLPSDYVDIVGVYLDSKLDNPVDRYLIEGATLVCEFDTVYLRYISNNYAVSTWNPSFARVVSAYLARDIANKLAPDELTALDTTFKERVEVAVSLEGVKETKDRAKAPTGTLSADWIKIYNDALLILGMGAQKITSGTADSVARSIMDTSVDAGLVEDLLEDIGWFWAQKSTKSAYDPSVEPDWGYSRAHSLPNDMHRLDGVFTDEYMRSPMVNYHQEEDVIYTDSDDFYMLYVCSDFLTVPATWPTKFKRLVASKLALDVAPSFPTADYEKAMLVHRERESTAKSADIMQSPPRLLSNGEWTGARFRGIDNRRRP
jgi:hypothetical protein